MYDVLSVSLKEIITIYIMFLGACIITFPIAHFVIGAITKGLSKWT